jgi:hypothetical protein
VFIPLLRSDERVLDIVTNLQTDEILPLVEAEFQGALNGNQDAAPMGNAPTPEQVENLFGCHRASFCI